MRQTIKDWQYRKQRFARKKPFYDLEPISVKHSRLPIIWCIQFSTPALFNHIVKYNSEFKFLGIFVVQFFMDLFVFELLFIVFQ